MESDSLPGLTLLVSSRRGALIFIDEADSFLEDRDSLLPARVRVLNEFIYHTGTESRDVSLPRDLRGPL